MKAARSVVVVGLGAMGSAALLALALRGARPLGIDRFDPPHPFGSSHGESRITREAIGEGEDYVALARRAMALWRRLEAETGQRLLEPTGVLVIDEAGARGPGPAAPGRRGSAPVGGKPDFFDRTLAAARGFAIAHEVLAPDEARRRHPALAVPEGARVYFEPGGGVLRPEACIAALLASARANGAEVRTGERVLGIEEDGQGVVVVTDQGRHGADRAIVCAGAWTAELIGERLGARLAVHRQRQHWFAPSEPAMFQRDCLPPFIWMHGARPDDWFYGFPELAPGGGVKLASERFVDEVDPEAPPPLDDETDALALLSRHAAGRVVGLSARRLRSTACLYTMAPESRFRVGWSVRGVLAVSACSGHGFKHAPAIGEAVAALVLDGVPPAALRPFVHRGFGATESDRL